jgi:hypothetical protein
MKINTIDKVYRAFLILIFAGFLVTGIFIFTHCQKKVKYIVEVEYCNGNKEVRTIVLNAKYDIHEMQTITRFNVTYKNWYGLQGVCNVLVINREVLK